MHLLGSPQMSSQARVILSVVTKDGTALIYIAESGALKLEFTGSLAMELSDPVLISKLTEAFDRHRQDERQMTLPFQQHYGEQLK